MNSEKKVLFLCHEHDWVTAQPIVEQTKVQLGKGWLLTTQIIRGGQATQDVEMADEEIDAACILIGGYACKEHAALQERIGELLDLVSRAIPLIPIYLPGTSGEPPFAVYLRTLAYVDFRRNTPDPMTMLLWGITGEKPLRLLF